LLQRVRENLATTNVVAALFDRVTLHQIDGTLQTLGQAQMPLQRDEAACRLGFHQEIGGAAIRIEVGAACCGAEHRQPAHRMVAAQKGDGGAVLLDQVVHGVSVSGWRRRFTTRCQSGAGRWRSLIPVCPANSFERHAP